MIFYNLHVHSKIKASFNIFPGLVPTTGNIQHSTKNLVLFLQYLLYGLNIYSAKSESNSMLCLGSIGISLTPTQKMQMEKSSILDGVKGKWRFPYTPLIN